MRIKPPVLILSAALAITGCDTPEPMAVGQTAWDRVELISEAAEPITTIETAEGDRVAEGDVILRQDPARAAAQLEQAQSARSQAAARLAEQVRGPRSERIDEARARLEGAESRLANAEKQLARIRELLERNLSTPADRDDAEAARDAARSEVNQARASLDALLEGTTIEELQQAEASLAQAEARVRELEVVEERLTVRAPRAGVVDALPFEVGERPPAGATVAVLLAGERPYARVYVPEPQRIRLRPGDRVPVHVDGLDRPLEGRVRFVASDPAFTPFFALTEHDRSRLSYLAEIDLPAGGDQALPAGVPVQVTIPDE